MSSKKKYLNQSFTIVRRAEDALFSTVAGLSSPLLSKSGAGIQSPSAWRPTFYFTWCMTQSLGQARRTPSLVTGRSYREKVHWRAHCRLSMVVPVNPLFLRANATCSTNWLCLSHSILFSKVLTLSHSVWDFSLHITFCFYFPFLIQHINVSGKECIGLYAWTDSPWAVLQHSIQIKLDHISEQGLNAAKVRTDSGNLLYNITHGILPGNILHQSPFFPWTTDFPELKSFQNFCPLW